MSVLLLVGCDQSGTQEMAREFARVQRTLNDRVDELEAELEQVRADAEEAESGFVTVTNELVAQVAAYREKYQAVRTELANVRAVEESWQVRKRPIEEPGDEPSGSGPTLADVDAKNGPVSFDSIFDEVDEDEDEDEGSDEDADAEEQDCPLLVGDMKFIGRKRLDGRRDSKYWTKAMEVDVENPTDRVITAQMWAHPPPAMGWYFDDFGPKQLQMKPGQKRSSIVIPYNPDFKLFLLIDKKMYSFPFEGNE